MPYYLLVQILPQKFVSWHDPKTPLGPQSPGFESGKFLYLENANANSAIPREGWLLTKWGTQKEAHDFLVHSDFINFLQASGVPVVDEKVAYTILAEGENIDLMTLGMLATRLFFPL